MTPLIEQVKLDEGFRRHPYRCTAGVLTIGYGRNIDENGGGKGLDETEASFLLRNDLAAAEIDLKGIFPNWSEFDQVRKGALINMRFQLGGGGIRGFRMMISAINRGDWLRAAREATDSRWARQTPERAYRVAHELRGGVSMA